MNTKQRVLNKIWQYAPNFLRKKMDVSLPSVQAYKKWAAIYDAELDKGNVTVFYNDQLINKLINKVEIEGKVVCDFGAGTGRHYPKIAQYNPRKYIACDNSEAMLKHLIKKYPKVAAKVIQQEKLNFARVHSIDLIFSSLTIGHILNIEATFTEWNRILNMNGFILLTLFHPTLAKLRTARSFKNQEGELVIIENYKHSIKKLKRLFQKLGWQILVFEEESIDAAIKPMLQDKHPNIYKKIAGQKIVCGFVLKKIQA